MNQPQRTQELDLRYFQDLLLERLAALQRQAVVEGCTTRTEGDRQRIHLALDRIRRDNYWNCFKCGEDITEERLLVNPTTLTCIDCESGPKKS